MITDSIGNYLTSIRNAISAEHKTVQVPASNIKKEITKVLMDQGYILNYKFDKEGSKEKIKIALKYNSITKIPAIRGIDRISTPGLRKYSSATDLPRVLNGLGIAIISTSKGIMSDKKARKMNIGGEVICYVY
jgi:small subunit ribosomal protein S8|tara:strand:- start:409 stop:807 length:399 start_codon:yes stop_codon:yes gene_type:complete